MTCHKIVWRKMSLTLISFLSPSNIIRPFLFHVHRSGNRNADEHHYVIKLSHKLHAIKRLFLEQPPIKNPKTVIVSLAETFRLQ